MKKLDLSMLRVQEHLHEEQDWNGRLRDAVQDEECEELHDCDRPARSQCRLGSSEIKGAGLVESVRIRPVKYLILALLSALLRCYESLTSECRHRCQSV